MEILNFYSRVNAQNLHAKGGPASSLLIQRLDCRPGERILEIGFGTGATLVQLCSRYQKTRFFGIESSKEMFEKAKARLRFCLLGNEVSLHLTATGSPFPFEAHSFDKVYAESVLGIQEGEDLHRLLLEIRKMLKPGGILILNETLWLDSTPLQEINRINEACKRDFGIIQSNAAYPYQRDWQNLLSRLGFQLESITPLGQIRADLSSEFPFPYRQLSFVFTAFGKLKAWFHPALRKAQNQYHRSIQQINSQPTPLMEGVLITARSIK